MSEFGKYLGFPLLNRRPKKSDFAFIVEKMNVGLASWKGKLLNKASKWTLAKSVLSLFPIYPMQSFWLPLAIGSEIDKVTRRFLWSKGNLEKSLHLLNWDVVSSPIFARGLGIRRAREVNIALLVKLVWSLLHDRRKLWLEMFANKYLKG